MQQKKLRKGYTTGTCAQAATKAAIYVLLGICRAEGFCTVQVELPKGEKKEIPLYNIKKGDGWAACEVIKDSGDDPDITNGVKVCSRVEKFSVDSHDMEKIILKGGRGIGRVTRPGLEQPVGEAAINRVPRQMIIREVRDACEETEYRQGILIEISIPEGEQLAKKTFNPRLGVEGGLSILGTSGIVEPMSEQALVDTIRLEMKVKLAECGENHRRLILAPGNYGLEFLQETYGIAETEIVKCSNFIGQSIDMAKELHCEGVLFAGHIGKMIKAAGGIMNTHSKWGDCRMELLASAALRAGIPGEKALKLLECVTTDEALSVCSEKEREILMRQVMKKIQEHLDRRGGEQMETGAVVFSKEYGILGKTENADYMIDQWKQKEGGNCR